MSRTFWISGLSLLFWVVLAQCVGILGSVFTFDSISTWYVTLAKPSFSPPNWVFGPAWVTLYALMGIAAWRIWERRSQPGSMRALAAYGIQLGLNGIWTPVFFGLHNTQLALAIIIALWVMILVTIYRFASIDRVAAWLLVPYIAWVSFASVLNLYIVLLN